ncbi:MAG: hypothetical protein U0641_03075 [Anaerolineae bacterium]
MSQAPPPPATTDATLAAECAAAARRVLADHGWALVADWDAFVAEAQAIAEESASQASLRPRPGDTPRQRAERAVIRAYCPHLYAACREGRGPRCDRAFDELGRYLHAVARARTHDADIAESAAQRALEIIWRRLDDVREPWAFLGYARIVLVRELGAAGRADETPRLVALRGDDAEAAGVAPADPRAEDARAEAEAAAQEGALRRAIRDCLRSAAQAETILRLFLEGESVTAVARALRTTPANVWVLKSRALTRLRKCPDVARLATE